jgi:hypothetical protein
MPCDCQLFVTRTNTLLLPLLFCVSSCRAPLRAVVPGHVGVRNVKWLSGIVVSPVEADGPWQRGMAYKVTLLLCFWGEPALSQWCGRCECVCM